MSEKEKIHAPKAPYICRLQTLSQTCDFSNTEYIHTIVDIVINIYRGNNSQNINMQNS